MRHLADVGSPPYQRGYVDSVLNRPYRDGVNPSHRLLVYLPGWTLANHNQAEYREGWLAGKTTP
jgi:hypothetical protein